MKKLSLLTFLLALGLTVSPISVFAAEDSPDEVIESDTVVGVDEDVGEGDTSQPDGEPSSEPIAGEPVITYEEIALDNKPDDLDISLPSNFDLSNYSYEGSIHIGAIGDNKYRVDIMLKNTDIEYINEDDDTVYGVASLGLTNLSYEDVTNGIDIPITIKVDETDLVGDYSANVSFSIDIYQEIEVSEELTEDEELPEDEVVEEEVTDSDTSKEDNAGVVDLTVSDPVIDDSYFSSYPNLETITITKDVTSISPLAFDNLGSLTDIYFDGSESLWNEIFMGSLNGVVVHFGEEDIQEPAEDLEDGEIPEEVVDEPDVEAPEEVTDEPDAEASEEVTDEPDTNEEPEEIVDEPDTEEVIEEEPIEEVVEEQAPEEPVSEEPIAEESIEG